MSTLPEEANSASQAYTKMTAFLTGGDKSKIKSIKLPAKVREQGAAAKVKMTGVSCARTGPRDP